MKILIIIQDINNIHSYSMHLINIEKKKHRIIKIESITNMNRLTIYTIPKKINSLLQDHTITLIITPIPRMVRSEGIESIYQPRIGTGSQTNQGYNDGQKRYEESLAISYYIELLPLIKSNGASYDNSIGTAIFVDDGAKVNTYRLNHYEIKPLSLAFLYAIYYTYKRNIDSILDELEIIHQEEIATPYN